MAIAERVPELGLNIPAETSGNEPLKPVKTVQIYPADLSVIRIESVDIEITKGEDQVAVRAIFDRPRPHKALPLENLSKIVFFAGYNGGYTAQNLHRLAQICTPGAGYEPALFIGGPTHRPWVLTEAQVSVSPLSQPKLRDLAQTLKVGAKVGEPESTDNTTASCADVNTLFQWIFLEYEQPIYQYVYRLVGNIEDARDFTQDAFLKAYKKLPETLARGDFQPLAWLYKIATNVCFDEFRHRKLVKWQPWEVFISDFHPSQIARDDPEREAMQTETKEEIQAVLAKLLPHYRAVLILREYHGLGHEEIAQVLGYSRTAIRHLLLRARQSFRLQYAKKHAVM